MSEIFKKSSVAEEQLMIGKARILKALKHMERCFSESYLVPLNNTYFKSYNSAYLNPPRNRRELHKTILLNKRKGQYINFSIRCALSVMKSGDKNSPLKMVTVHFSVKYAEKLASRKNTLSYYGQLLKYRFSKLGISDFIAVFELASNKKERGSCYKGLHAHIVFNSKSYSDDSLKDVLKVERELLCSTDGKVVQSAFRITTNYHRIISYSPMAELENKDSYVVRRWRGRKSLVSINKYEIDIGLAEYLSKGLARPIFGRSRNYFISRALNKKISNLFNRANVLEE